MAVRGGTAPGRVLCMAAVLRGIGAALATAGVAVPAGICAAAASEAVQPLAHHATVLNGEVAGSGFAIAHDRVLTNAHVVRGLAPGALLVLVASTEAPDGSRAQVLGRVLAISDRMDLALLSVPAGFLPQVGAADAPLLPGLALHAAGIDAGGGALPLPRMELPGRLVGTRPGTTAFGPGLVARLPGVRPGFSGGPVLDDEGRLVGMIAAIRPARPGPPPLAATGRVRVHRPFGTDEALVLPAEAIRAEAARLGALMR